MPLLPLSTFAASAFPRRLRLRVTPREARRRSLRPGRRSCDRCQTRHLLVELPVHPVQPEVSGTLVVLLGRWHCQNGKCRDDELLRGPRPYHPILRLPPVVPFIRLPQWLASAPLLFQPAILHVLLRLLGQSPRSHAELLRTRGEIQEHVPGEEPRLQDRRRNRSRLRPRADREHGRARALEEGGIGWGRRRRGGRAWASIAVDVAGAAVRSDKNDGAIPIGGNPAAREDNAFRMCRGALVRPWARAAQQAARRLLTTTVTMTMSPCQRDDE